jgi:hypothetical protein
VSEFLAETERQVSVWCVSTLMGAEWAARLLEPHRWTADRVLAAELCGTAVGADSRDLWGDWVGHVTDFYRACAEAAAGLNPAQVQDLSGARGAALAAVVQHQYEQMSLDELPNGIQPGVALVQLTGRNNARVTGQQTYEVVDLDPRLLQLVAQFDGRRTEDAIAAASGGQEPEQIADLIWRLLDIGLLRLAPPLTPRPSEPAQ